MHRYDLTDLKIFAALARTGSLTAASRVLPYTVSALSLRLRRLEEAVGASLFTREARGLALTPAGDMLLAQAQNVLRAAAQLETAMSGFSRGERATLRVASNSTGLQSVIAPAAGPFLAGRSVRLVFLERRTRACLDAVRGRERGPRLRPGDALSRGARRRSASRRRRPARRGASAHASPC